MAPSAHAGKLPSGRQVASKGSSHADIEKMLAKLRVEPLPCTWYLHVSRYVINGSHSMNPAFRHDYGDFLIIVTCKVQRVVFMSKF